MLLNKKIFLANLFGNKESITEIGGDVIRSGKLKVKFNILIAYVMQCLIISLLILFLTD